MHARTEVVARHSSTALWNAQEHHKIFLKPVLKAMGSPWRMFRGRTLAKIAAVLGAVLAFVLAMAFVPCTLTIEGHGSLLPEERCKIYTPPVLGAKVREVLVDHGDHVKKGDTLIRLESPELDKEYRQLQLDEGKALTQASTLQTQLQKAGRMQQGQGSDDPQVIQGQLWEAKLTAKNARERIEIIEEQRESMNIRSPQDGIITTWEAKKNLMGRPVDVGTELLQIASTEGEWLLEVEVPDDDMAPILAAKRKLEEDIAAGRKKEGETLSAYFVTMTDPEHRYNGYVRRIAPSAENVAESEQYKNRHVVKVTVGFPEEVRLDYLRRNQTKEMRPGPEVRARVDCGPTNLAYYLLRKPIQVFYESVLFRWPFLR
jgi:multidrug efflux pump subunit AcrA (membrane-fusion protein)